MTISIYTAITDDHFDTLMEYVNQHNYQTVYVLIDPRSGVNIPWEWLDPVQPVNYCIIRDIQDHSSQNQQCLHLFAFTPSQFHWLKESVDLAQDKYQRNGICGWLFSRKTIDELAKHLTTQLVMRYQARYYQFRYYDPRVMALLPSILREIQLDFLFGIVGGWGVMNRYDKLMFVEHQERLMVGDNFLELDHWQWNKLTYIGLFNKTLDAYHIVNSEPPSYQQQYCVWQSFIYVDRYKMVSETDILMLTKFSLCCGLKIVKDILLERLVKQSVVNHEPLVNLLAQNYPNIEWLSNEREQQ